MLLLLVGPKVPALVGESVGTPVPGVLGPGVPRGKVGIPVGVFFGELVVPEEGTEVS